MLFSEASLLQRPDIRLMPELVQMYRASGAWRDVPLHHALRQAASSAPDRVAVVTRDVDTGSRSALTYLEYDEAVDRLATALRGLSIAPGYGVAVMLPNRHEFGISIFAINRIGAVYTGIPASYGEREILHILRTTGARAIIVQDTLRGRGLFDQILSIKDQTNLETIIVVRESDADTGSSELAGVHEFAELLETTAEELPELADPGAVCHVGFTSGTSGAPKGVMNTHNNLDHVLREWISAVGAESFGTPVVNLLPSPVGHHSGFLWGVLMSAHLCGTAVFVTRWSVPAIARIVEEEGATTMIAAPTFLQDLLEHPESEPSPSSPWRLIAIPGAPIPRRIVQEAAEAFGAFVCPSWGMTEWGIGITARPTDDPEQLSATDGSPVATCEVRVVDADGRAVIDQEGDLQMRGPGLFVGYLDRPDATEEAFHDGWFDTGDRAVLRQDGFIRIQGRSKDIIIRGGENIPVSDVENLLVLHPDIREVALVAIPDERLGERACAVIVSRRAPDAPPLTLPEVTQHLLSHGLSKHYLPEYVVSVAELPKTMSGKVRKIELRESLPSQLSR